MKSYSIILFVLAYCTYCLASGQGNLGQGGLGQGLCSQNHPSFERAYSFYLGYGSPENTVWQHKRIIITPQLDGKYSEVISFNTWAFNYYNQDECRFQGVEINAALDGSNVVYIVQELDSNLQIPCFCPRNMDDTPQIIDVEWGTPPFFESVFAESLDRIHTTVGTKSSVGMWTDPNTGKLSFVESAHVFEQNQRALSLLAVPVETSPGDTTSTIFGAIVIFESDIVTPPEPVAQALNLYLSGQLPLGQDPNSPDPLLVYRYDPPMQTRSIKSISDYERQNAVNTGNGLKYYK